MTLIQTIIATLSTLLRAQKTYVHLVKLEAQLATLSLLPLTKLLLLALLVLLSIWLNCLLLLAYAIYHWVHNPLWVLAILLLLQCLFLSLLMGCGSHYLQKMTFVRSRHYLKLFRGTDEATQNP